MPWFEFPEYLDKPLAKAYTGNIVGFTVIGFAIGVRSALNLNLSDGIMATLTKSMCFIVGSTLAGTFVGIFPVAIPAAICLRIDIVKD